MPPAETSVPVSASRRMESHRRDSRRDSHHSGSSQQEKDAAIARLVEVQMQMQQNQEEFRRELRQIALSVAKVEKRPAVDEEAQGEPVAPMGPPPPPPPPPLQQGATPGTAPLVAPLQARMRQDVGGPLIAGSGQTVGGSGAVGGDSVPVGTG